MGCEDWRWIEVECGFKVQCLNTNIITLFQNCAGYVLRELEQGPSTFVLSREIVIGFLQNVMCLLF
jgi:hypothetical protein